MSGKWSRKKTSSVGRKEKKTHSACEDIEVKGLSARRSSEKAAAWEIVFGEDLPLQHHRLPNPKDKTKTMKNPVYLDVKKFFSGKPHIDHELADAYAQHLLAIAIDNGEFRMRHSASWDFMREAI